jgi:hypothetical protein
MTAVLIFIASGDCVPDTEINTSEEEMNVDHRGILLQSLEADSGRRNFLVSNVLFLVYDILDA